MQPLSLQQLVTHSDGLCCPTRSDGSLGNKCSSELFLTLSEAPALSCDVIGLRHSSAQPSLAQRASGFLTEALIERIQLCIKHFSKAKKWETNIHGLGVT